MRTFNLIIQDSRYPESSLETTTVRDHRSARRVACQKLQENPFHIGIQVRDDDGLLYWLRRMHVEASESQPQAL